MNTSMRDRMAVAVLGFFAVAASAAPAAEKQKFTLGQYVPADCWMYVHGAYNPEHDFIDAHWAKVFDAVKKSGIGEDIKTLVFSEAPPEQRAQIEQGWAQSMKLLAGVRWGDLMKQEMVIAERLNNFIPEIALLCRSVPESVEPNVAGLKAIMDQLATLLSLTVTESAVQDIKTWKLSQPNMPMQFFIFQKDNIVGIVMGEKMLQDVTGLMTSPQPQGALVQSPRFKKAVGELPAPEDAMGYFDLKMLLDNLNGIFETAFKKAGEDAPSESAVARRIVSKIVDHLNFLDTMTFVSRTDGRQEFTDSAVRLQPECTQKSLCRMFTARQPFERFDHYIPKDATGFALWGFWDLRELYRAVLDFIKEDVPGGPEVLSKWAQAQQDMGFEMEADFFSWWSGEMISVDMPAALKTPFGGSDSVLLVRVKDGKLAAAEVNAGIDRVAALAKEHNQGLIIQDATDVHAEGFRSVTHPMMAAMMIKPVVGVAGDQLILGSSAAAINKCLDTAAGKTPSIVENARFKAEGLAPKGPVCSASFTDLSSMGQELAGVLFSMGLVGGFIPDQPDTKPIKAIMGMLNKLSPAIAEINFYSSQSSVCEFDGQVWRTRQVMTYKPAEATSDVAQKP